jgi:hypothetical protein
VVVLEMPTGGVGVVVEDAVVGNSAAVEYLAVVGIPT